MTSRELVKNTLEFKNTAGRVPRDLWTLPWAHFNHPDMIEKLRRDFVWDFGGVPVEFAQKPIGKGDMYEVGECTDDWGCVFKNIQRGVIGEVKKPLVTGDEWEDAANVHFPEEWLTFDIEKVNEHCRASDKFVLSACIARPFEQLQFIRGTVNLYMDLMDPPKAMLEFMEKMHDFYCRLCTKWAQTDVDGISFMDDWGSQSDLLINPTLWDKYFAPFYRDFIDIAHKHGKKAFMHSDGHTLRIIPKLIDMGLDAMNAQIFCIGVENLRQYRGKITFWGEMDRQHLLPHGSIADIENAVDSVYENLWQDGGCIAQCEFGAGAKPENVYRMYEKWNEIRK
ncbi:MAG: methyltransferase [Clostridia bacterium]|nr:methyltransferase [Clostridia bacterium]